MPRKKTAVALPVAPDDEFPGLDADAQNWVRQGQVDVYPGRDPGKPVIRWAAGNTLGKHPGALAPGSGVSPRTPSAENGKRGAIKQTAEYKALMQRILSADDGGAFEEVIQGMIHAAKGGTRIVKYDCEECHHENRVEIKDPPNPLAGKALIEFMIGRAPQHTEVDVNAKILMQELSVLTTINPQDFITPAFTPDEINERKRIVEATIVKDE